MHSPGDCGLPGTSKTTKRRRLHEPAVLSAVQSSSYMSRKAIRDKDSRNSSPKLQGMDIELDAGLQKVERNQEYRRHNPHAMITVDGWHIEDETLWLQQRHWDMMKEMGVEPIVRPSNLLPDTLGDMLIFACRQAWSVGTLNLNSSRAGEHYQHALQPKQVN